MALATTCPQCRTSFKVVPDQLKLRRGLVRCGVCQHVFSGIDTLRHVADVPRASMPTTADLPVFDPSAGMPLLSADPTQSVAADEPPQDANVADDGSLKTAFFLPEAGQDTDRSPPADPGPAIGVGAVWRDRGDDRPQDSHTSDRQTRIDTVGDAEDRPRSDLFAAPRKGHSGRHTASPAAWAGLAVLALLLLAQVGIGWRDALSARIPVAGPALVALASPFGLTVDAPRELDVLTIESFELQSSAVGTDRLAMTALLRNRASHRVAWPAIELTLTDTSGAVLLRKAILASDYLGDDRAALATGLPPNSERAIDLALRHPGPPPSGYSAALFHP